jgi:hypothetical protein
VIAASFLNTLERKAVYILADVSKKWKVGKVTDSFTY